MHKEPFVSVLTPVYNGGKYLEECILSVLDQSYSNWEYVIVNNRSTDITEEIIQKYAGTDSRIKVCTNSEHLPVMENLNHTFRQISPESKYCKVVHADDTIFRECIRQMVDLAEKYPSIGIVNSYRISNRKVSPTEIPYPDHFFPGRDISRQFLLGNSSVFSAPSNLLIRSDLIRKRAYVYDSSYLQSDYSACLDMLRESDFGFIHQVLSYTRRHKDSITETMALKESTYMLGNLRVLLDFGHYYLDENEQINVLQQRTRAFYIQFARNILRNGFHNTYLKHKKELESIDIALNRLRLGAYLMREIVANTFAFFSLDIIHSSRNV